MAENDIVALKELASGGFLEVALAPADIAAAPASHTHAAADITDLATNGNAAALYDEIAGQVGLEVSDYTLKLYGDTGSAEFDTSNLTTGRNILFPNADGTLALNPMTTAGDLFVGGTSGAPARLALGTASQQLRVNSGATSLEYFTPAAAFNPASPGAIGNTTPAAGTFTTLTAAPSSGSALTLTGGTVTASAPLISATQTWNDNAVTFTGLAATITNTASATASLVARLTVGSTNVFEVDGRGFTKVRKVSTSTEFVSVFEVLRGTTSVVRLRDDGDISGSAFAVGTGGNVIINTSGVGIQSTARFGISSSAAASTTDCDLNRDAADTFAQRRTTNAQEYRVYGTYTSTTNFQRLTIKTKAVTLSALSGASVATTGGFIPDGAVLVGLTTRVSTAITGATGYDIGDGSDADRWGANIGIALNTSSDNRDWTAGTIECFTAAQEVTLTAVGSNFTGGAVVIVAHYLAGEAD
jgi:hypothetical protein